MAEKSYQNQSQSKIVKTEPDSNEQPGVNQELQEVDSKLVEAYRNLDRERRRMKKVRTFVYDIHTNDTDEDEPNGGGEVVDWYKLR